MPLRNVVFSNAIVLGIQDMMTFLSGILLQIWIKRDLSQDRIWKRIRDENCFKHLKLKKKSDPNELREIRKSDLRFRGVKTNSSELYEFSEHDENLSLAQMQLFSFQLRLRMVSKISFSSGLYSTLTSSPSPDVTSCGAQNSMSFFESIFFVNPSKFFNFQRKTR